MGLFSKKKESEAPANGHAVTLNDGSLTWSPRRSTAWATTARGRSS